MRSIRLVTATAAALVCLGALSACGPDDNGGQDAGKTAAPAPSDGAPSAPAPSNGAPSGAAPSGAPTGAAKGIPAKAWMDTKSIPMDETYHYAPLAANAKPLTGVVQFKGMELCHAPVAKDDEYMFTGTAAAKASVGFGGDRWTAQQTLLFEGDPTHSSGTKQMTNLTDGHLTDALKGCAKTVPGATVKVTSGEGAPFFAAVLTVPQADGSTVTLHEYVVTDGGVVNELSVWATAKGGAQPKDAWKAPEDKYVGSGMSAPMCEALPGCDGR
ncbi:hypothetical protein [Streptomyces sp. NRRL S-350]|uniref:hypothetical protein n=1 Tax=Streptomyces sp. NRRL S-350 TaxID=1463902 RepID=UPI0004BFA308|nr:hypothetical protein [Streptomyces sp. NRRL S-350]